MLWVALASCSPPALPAVENDGELGQEVCDGVDNDGDGMVDDQDASLDPTGGVLVYIDLDRDGHGTETDRTRRVCDPLGIATVANDCNDMDPSVHPGARRCATTWMTIATGSRTGPIRPAGSGPPISRWVDTTGDCDDGAADVFPGALDLCDGVDNACQGSEDGCVHDAVLSGPYVTAGAAVTGAAFGSDATGSWVALGLPESGALDRGIPVGAAYALGVPTVDVDVGATATAWVTGDGSAGGTGRLIRAPGDVDGDGLADLLVEARVGYVYWTYYDRYGVVILDASASGELTPWDLQTLLDVDAHGVVLHPDLDGDGQADLVLGTDDVLAITGPIPAGSTWEDLTPTTISTDRSYAVSRLPDMDGDGLEDIGSNGGGSLAILSSRDGLRAQFLFETGYMIRTTALDDLDGDGLPEIAVATIDDGVVSHEPSAVWIFSGAARGTLSRDDAIAALSGPELEPDVPDPALAWTPGTLLIGDATGAWFVDTSTILGP